MSTPNIILKSVPWPAQADYEHQSVPVPGTKRPGQTAHFRNGAYGFMDTSGPNVPTGLLQIFNSGLQISKDRECLGYRPQLSSNPIKFADHYVWLTYAQVDVRRRQIGSALYSLFQKGELGGGELDTVGVWAHNRPEWQIVDLALQAYKKVGVSLYDTLGKDSAEYIISHANLTVIFASSQHIPTLLKLSPQVPVLKMIVSLDPLSPESKHILTSWATVQNIQVKELSELEAYGKEHLLEPFSATRDDVASLCYTSGTTGNPKGVVLTHGHLTMGTLASIHGVPFHKNTVLLSYLPLAHIYERLCELDMLAVGGRIGYSTGDPLRLLEDVQVLRPNFFPSVPRVLNRLYQAAMASGNVPGLRGAIFKKAVQVKLEKLRATGDNTHPLWDRLVFRKIQAVLGGNLELVITGSAPISIEVMDFLKIAFSCDVIEGYGMTENCATCTRCWPRDPSSSGTIGAPHPATEIKLLDVPAMGYTSEDKPNPRGEICTRGSNTFSVYYKDETNTKSTVDEEGWVHTGDVAEMDSRGRFKIIDRVKNIMKLAQGEYVALEKIENSYDASPAVAQIYVHGDSLQSYLLAVVVADPPELATIASKVLRTPLRADDLGALAKAVRDPEVNAAVMKILDKEAKRNGLKGFEKIKRIYLTLEPFTVENGTMTPTFKIKRKDAYRKYKAELDALYALGEPRSH